MIYRVITGYSKTSDSLEYEEPFELYSIGLDIINKFIEPKPNDSLYYDSYPISEELKNHLAFNHNLYLDNKLDYFIECFEEK